MNIQIFGTKKCNDTKKAERFFKERGIKYQFIDMKEKGMSKGEFQAVVRHLQEEHHYNMVILMLTDVLLEGTQLLYVGSDEAIRNAFSAEPKDNALFLPGVMSRKKQVIPMLSALWG